jgi:hypothetical protein
MQRFYGASGIAFRRSSVIEAIVLHDCTGVTSRFEFFSFLIFLVKDSCRLNTHFLQFLGPVIAGTASVLPQ